MNGVLSTQSNSFVVELRTNPIQNDPGAYPTASEATFVRHISVITAVNHPALVN